MSQVKTALKAAKSALDKQDFETAVLQAKEVVSQDPENYFGYVFLGRALEKQGKAQSAIEPYERAASIKPGEDLAWKGLCNIYETFGSKGVQGFTSASLELAKVYAEK